MDFTLEAMRFRVQRYSDRASIFRGIRTESKPSKPEVKGLEQKHESDLIQIQVQFSQASNVCGRELQMDCAYNFKMTMRQ